MRTFQGGDTRAATMNIGRCITLSVGKLQSTHNIKEGNVKLTAMNINQTKDVIIKKGSGEETNNLHHITSMRPVEIDS
jgi:hypothetical protein